MAEGEGEETTRRTTTTTKTMTTTGIARVRDAVAVTPTPRELVLSGRVRVNGIVETQPNWPVRRNNDVIEVLRGSGGRTPLTTTTTTTTRLAGRDRADSVLISDWLEGAVVAVAPPPSSGNDGGGREFRAGSMKTAGRLDEESEGLILLTDDGSFSRLLCDPEFGLGKTYRVVVRGSCGCGGCVRGGAAAAAEDDDDDDAGQQT